MNHRRCIVLWIDLETGWGYFILVISVSSALNTFGTQEKFIFFVMKSEKFLSVKVRKF